MSATVPWSPIQLWKHHRLATTVGFLPPGLMLILLSRVMWEGPRAEALIEVLVCVAWGTLLAHLFAGRRWITASLALLGLPVTALVALFVLTVDFGDAPPSTEPNAPRPDSGVEAPRPNSDVVVPPGSSSTPRVEAPRPAPRPDPPVKASPDFDAFRAFSRQLVNGVVGFDYPPRMRVGDRTDVSLRVSGQKTVQELRDSLTREGRDPIVEPVKLSSRMRAELHGFGFELTPLSSVEQVTDAEEDTMWTWDVRATEAGKQRLTVTLTAIIEMEGTEGARDVSTFYREVEVEALPNTWWESTRDIAREYGPSRDVLWPAIPTGIAAVWAFLVARRKARQKRGRRK